MANFGGLLKSLNDLANHYDDIAKQAGKTDAEHWADEMRDSAGAPPPYALPPFIMFVSDPVLDADRVEAEAKGLYKNRSPWGFLVNEVFRTFPPPRGCGLRPILR